MRRPAIAFCWPDLAHPNQNKVSLFVLSWFAYCDFWIMVSKTFFAFRLMAEAASLRENPAWNR
uniref:Uncharacterized protein n=1 Tax=Zea mays TaxID=4577 RepID=B6SK45_MAIZE|nr:hypothetical protein [Zea mays]